LHESNRGDVRLRSFSHDLDGLLRMYSRELCTASELRRSCESSKRSHNTRNNDQNLFDFRKVRSDLRCTPLCLFRTTRIMDSTDEFVSDTSSVMNVQFSITELLGRLLLYGGTNRANSICLMTSSSITNLPICTGTISLSHPLYVVDYLQGVPRAKWNAYFAIPAVCYRAATTPPPPSRKDTI
jgi:hypothetical protein